MADGVWTGGPSKPMIQIIHCLTRVDSDGRLYWRQYLDDPWRRLRGPVEYTLFNNALDKRRSAIAFLGT